MKLFVSKNDTIKIEIYAFEHQDTANCVVLKSDIPSDVTQYETLEFVFRIPSYNDSTNVLKSAQAKNDMNQLDIAGFQDSLLRTLLIGWNLKDHNGQDIKVSPGSIDSLLPVIARTACTALLEKVKL